MTSDTEARNNIVALALLLPFILIPAAGVVTYAPVLHGDTVGTLPVEEQTDAALRFEQINGSATADITESDLDSDTIERVDNAIDNGELAYAEPGEDIPRSTFEEGAVYRHGDEYYRVTYEEESVGKYPPVGHVTSPSITLSFMTMAVYFSGFALITTAYYIISIVGMGNSWHYETKDLVFYTLMAGNIMVIATTALIFF